MNKQEIIREGIKDILYRECGLTAPVVKDIPKALREILSYLHSQGVVRRVKCPDCEWSQFGEESVGMTPCHSCNSTGYIYEPLLEGK